MLYKFPVIQTDLDVISATYHGQQPHKTLFFLSSLWKNCLLFIPRKKWDSEF